MKTTSTFKYLYQIGLVTIIMLFSLVFVTLYNILPRMSFAKRSSNHEKVMVVDTVHEKVVVYDTITQKINKIPKVTQVINSPEPIVETTPTTLDTTK